MLKVSDTVLELFDGMLDISARFRATYSSHRLGLQRCFSRPLQIRSAL
jgi:hypothetical protein